MEHHEHSGPTKDALIDTLFLDKVDEIVSITESAALGDDAGEAFLGFVFGNVRVAGREQRVAAIVARLHELLRQVQSCRNHPPHASLANVDRSRQGGWMVA